MESQEQEETMQQEPDIYSSEKNDELMFEDGPEMTGDQTWKNNSLSGFGGLPVDTIENSWEHKVPLRLFCYGVRHYYSSVLTN